MLKYIDGLDISYHLVLLRYQFSNRSIKVYCFLPSIKKQNYKKANFSSFFKNRKKGIKKGKRSMSKTIYFLSSFIF